MGGIFMSGGLEWREGGGRMFLAMNASKLLGEQVYGCSAERIVFVDLVFLSSRRRHTRFDCDWSSEVCSSDLPRLMDVTGGAVLVGGVDVRELDPQVLSDAIGLVPQRPYLFSGTIASNLRYGNQAATDADLWHALEIAQAADFVREMPGGLDAPIAQGGTNVSGGQRQRLAIARALVKKAGIFIFDDSFSSLDFGTDARLRAALERELGWATVIIVAQRVGTIMNADRILVMDAGRIVGSGTHTELLESSETYREIVYSQLSEAEAVA